MPDHPPGNQPVTATVLDTPAAAQRLGVSPATLSTWRCTNAVRVPFVRVGRRVLYRTADLDRFLDEQAEAVANSGAGQ